MTHKLAAPPPTLQAAVADYLDWHALRGSSLRHRQDIRRMLLAFAAAVDAERPLDQVTREDCSAFLRSVQERGGRPNTLKAYHRVLDAFFNWLLLEERLNDSPMQRVPKPKLPQEQIRPLTPEELARLLAQPDRKTFIGARDVAFIALLADTGLRISEAIHIRIADVDERLHSIAVMGKGEKPRTVFYGEAVEALLKSYLRRRGKAGREDLLFVNSFGEPLLRYCLTKRIQKYGRAAGIDGKRVSAHTLRHTFAVSWLLGRGDTLSLQRLLGHSTPAMTTRYVNFAAADLARLYRTVSPLDHLTGTAAVKPTVTGQARKRLR